MINIIVVTHGDFGAYLFEAAEMIVGAQHEGVEIVSVSPRLSVEQVRTELDKAIAKSSGAGGIIIFTDILGGTPTMVSLPTVKDVANAAVISGVNLNMMLSAFSYRSKMEFAPLVAKVIEDGKKSICDVKLVFSKARTV